MNKCFETERQISDYPPNIYRLQLFPFSFRIRREKGLGNSFYPFQILSFHPMDSQTKAWSCPALSNHEGIDLYLEEEEAVLEYVIVAKFLTKRSLNIDTIAKTFNPIWRSRNRFKVKK